jgi:hypothetical protein
MCDFWCDFFAGVFFFWFSGVLYFTTVWSETDLRWGGGGGCVGSETDVVVVAAASDQ